MKTNMMMNEMVENTLNENKDELINMCNGNFGEIKLAATNEMIVKVLNDNKEEIMRKCNTGVKDIRFKATDGIIEKQKMYNGVLLENITHYQAIRINVINDKDLVQYANTIYLKNDTLNASALIGNIGKDSLFEILHIIASIGDLEYKILCKEKHAYIITHNEKTFKVRK